MEINRILVIADQNRTRDVALDRAIALAQRSGASIHLVGFCYDPLIDDDSSPISFNRKKAQRELLSRKQQDLDWLLDRAQAEGVTITTETVWSKQLHQWVAEQADAYDLAVKTGHRSESAFYTPTDWHLLRTSPIPLLIVSSRRWKKAKHHVLATVDLGSKRKPQRDLNQQVLEMASAMATLLDSELHVVYSIPISKILRELEVVEPRIEERRFREQHAQQIDELCEQYGLSRKQIHLKAGDPDKVIAGAARKIKAELVVMGTLARKGIKAALIGNTAEAVLTHLPTDIVAMRLK
ncbi:MAG: universal stress protein UspE [Wenzhouxiangellaceae bacterium]